MKAQNPEVGGTWNPVYLFLVPPDKDYLLVIPALEGQKKTLVHSVQIFSKLSLKLTSEHFYAV